MRNCQLKASWIVLQQRGIARKIEPNAPPLYEYFIQREGGPNTTHGDWCDSVTVARQSESILNEKSSESAYRIRACNCLEYRSLGNLCYHRGLTGVRPIRNLLQAGIHPIRSLRPEKTLDRTARRPLNVVVKRAFLPSL